MRVISGKYRRLLLKAPKGLNTRPSLDQVKEATFSIIGYKIYEANCLDLFSGSGSLGIEALSRGAKKSHFNDINNESIKIIKENLTLCKVDDPYTITQLDYKVLLNRLNEKFDIIFVDPPFKDLIVADVIELMEQKQLVNPFCLFACETALDSPHISHPLYDEKEYRYASVRLTILRRKE